MGMNRRWVLIALGYAWSLGTMAQESASGTVASIRTVPDSGYFWPGRPVDHQLVFRTRAMYDASSIRNELVSALWHGGNIDRELRERSANNGGGPERAGYLLEADLSYAGGDRLFGNERIRPLVSVGWRQVMGVRYSDDLYNLTFFGNGAHENATMALAPSAFEQVRYQTLGLGIQAVGSGSFIALHLVNGQDMSGARIRQADLFTATDGRYLNLALDGDHVRSADDGNNGWRSRGIGAALSFQWVRPFTAGRHGLCAVIGGSDLGITAWNRRSLSVRRDSTILYQGIRLDGVLDLDNVLISREGIQDTLGLGFKEGGFIRPLPGNVYASLRLDGAFRMRYQAEVDMRYLPGYLPHAVLSATRAHERVWYRAEVSYGGFGGMRGGLMAGWHPCGGYWLEVGLRNVTGLMGGRMRGQALSVGMGYAW